VKQLAFSAEALGRNADGSYVKPLFIWFADIAWDPLAAFGATLVVAAAPLVVVSRQVLTGIERGKGPRPNLRIVEPRSEPALPVPAMRVVEQASAGDHWQRLTDVIASNIAVARNAAGRQAAARVKLDAADFALSQIFADLADVMPGLDRRPAAVPMAGRRLAA
jgi:hypothetical protein